MLSGDKKTHHGTLPQSQALENQPANVIPHGSERNGLGHCGSSPKEHSAATQPVQGEPTGNVNPVASPIMVHPKPLIQLSNPPMTKDTGFLGHSPL